MDWLELVHVFIRRSNSSRRALYQAQQIPWSDQSAIGTPDHKLDDRLVSGELGHHGINQSKFYAASPHGQFWVGVNRYVNKWTSGYALTLAETDATGEETRVFVRHKIIQQSPHGQLLGRELEQRNALNSRQIFILGKFVLTMLPNSTRRIRQLEITNSFFIHIGDEREHG